MSNIEVLCSDKRDFVKGSIKCLNLITGISTSGKHLTNASYGLKLNEGEELMQSCLLIRNDLTLNYYNVVVKYGNYARLEPRLIKRDSVFGKEEISITNENTLLDIIIINNNQEQSNNLYKKYSERIKTLLSTQNSPNPLKILKNSNEIDLGHFTGRFFNNKNLRTEAVSILKKCVDIPEYFLYESLYNSGFELSVGYLYLGQKDLAGRKLDSVYLSRYIGKQTRDNLFNNYFRFYLQQPITFKRLKRFTLSTMWYYTVMNSSTITINGKFYMTLRTVNYLHKTPNYISNDVDGHIRTTTFFCEMNSDFELIKKYRIVNKVDYIKHRESHVTCIEDLRLFHYQGRFWVIGTGIDTHFQKTHQMVIGRLNINCDKGEANIDKLVMLEYGSWHVQKNWIPLITKDGKGQEKLQIIYKYEPFTFLTVDLNSKSPKVVLDREVQQDIYCGSFKGSSIPFRYKNKWVMLIHTSKFIGNRNTYLQRFVEFNDEFKISRVSKLFQTVKHHMEYVMGAIYDENRREVYLSLSENDANGGVGAISQEYFESMLYDPRIKYNVL